MKTKSLKLKNVAGLLPEKKDLYNNVQTNFHAYVNWEGNGFNTALHEAGEREICLDEGEIEKILHSWATKEEARDKFGDVLLRSDCNDVNSIAHALSESIERIVKVKG
jgi:hypothetical protein